MIQKNSNCGMSLNSSALSASSPKSTWERNDEDIIRLNAKLALLTELWTLKQYLKCFNSLKNTEIIFLSQNKKENNWVNKNKTEYKICLFN